MNNQQVLEVLLKMRADTDKALAQFEGAQNKARESTLKWSEAQQKQAMAMSAAHDEALKMNRAIDQQGASLVSAATVTFAAAAAATALAAVFAKAVAFTIDATAAAMKYADGLAALADRTGLGTAALQALDVAAKLGNSSLDAVAAAVNKMQKNIVDGSAAFGKLGLSLSDLKKMSPEEQFTAVAKAIESIEDPAQRSAARIAVFGRSGNELAATLKAAAAGASELGGALSDEAAAAAADLQDKSDLLSSAWERVVLQFGAAIAQSPELQRAMDDLIELVSNLATKVAEMAPTIIRVFDELVVGARKAAAGLQLAAVAAMGPAGWGQVPAALKKFQDDLEQINLDRLFSDVEGKASSTAKKVVEFAGKAEEDAAKAAAKAALKREKEHAAALKRQEQEEQRYSKLIERESWRLENEIEKTMEALTKKHVEEILKRALEEQAANESNLARARESAAEMAAVVAEASRHAFDGWAEGLNEAVRIMDALGISAESGLGKIVGLAANTADMIAAAAQRGFFTISDLVGQAAQIFHKASVGAGALSGAMTGFAVGGPIGAGIGAIAGGLLGLFGKSKQAKEEMNKLRAELSGLMGPAKAAGISLEAALNAKTATALRSAIAGIKSELDILVQEQNELLDTAEKYGIELSQLGPTFAAQELDKMAAQIFKEFSVLKAGGVDMNLILEKMGPNMAEYVTQAIKAGVTIPKELQPIVDQLFAEGKILKENGEAYGSAEEAGVKYGESQSGMFEQQLDFLKRITEAIEKLAGIKVPPIKVPIEPEWGDFPGGNPGPGPKGPGGHFPENAVGGFYTQPTLAWMAEAGPAKSGGEFALPKDMLQQMLHTAAAMAVASHGGGGGNAPVYLGIHQVGKVLSRQTGPGGSIRIHPSGLTRGAGGF